MTSDRQQLAEYQAALLDILATATSPEAALGSIRKLAVTVEASGDSKVFDLRMVDVAIKLTQKWSVPKSSNDSISMRPSAERLYE